MSGTNIKIYKNEELLHDCILCKNPDGRAGWYDAVDGTFHPKEEEPAIREPLWAQYIDTGFSHLRKKSVLDTNVQTNADHIRSMTDEELAEFLAPSFSCYGCPARLFCEKDEVGTDCHELVSNWLKQPYGGDT